LNVEEVTEEAPEAKRLVNAEEVCDLLRELIEAVKSSHAPPPPPPQLSWQETQDIKKERAIQCALRLSELRCPKCRGPLDVSGEGEMRFTRITVGCFDNKCEGRKTMRADYLWSLQEGLKH